MDLILLLLEAVANEETMVNVLEKKWPLNNLPLEESMNQMQMKNEYLAITLAIQVQWSVYIFTLCPSPFTLLIIFCWGSFNHEFI